MLSKELDDELSQNQVKALEVITANDTFGNFNASQLASGWADLGQGRHPDLRVGDQPGPGLGQTRSSATRRCSASPAPPATRLDRQARPGPRRSPRSATASATTRSSAPRPAAASIKQYSDDAGGAEAVYTNDDLAFGLPNGIAPEVTAMK